MPMKKPRCYWLRQRPRKIVQWMQSHERSASWVTAGFTGLIFTVTAVYAITAVLQMKAMNASLKQQKEALAQSRETFQEGQRPYIWLTNDLGKPDCVRAPNTPDPPSCYVVWDWRFTNYGQSPAHNVKFSDSMIIGDNVLQKPRVFAATWPAAPLPPKKEDFHTALWPDRITPERYDGLLNTEESILIFGKINYTDARGGNYETGFCLYRLRTGAIAYCSTGNYIK